jgi:hypothetical protein
MSMVNKRVAAREEEASSPSPGPKKLKAADGGDPTLVGAHELASALALASLASLSPKSTSSHDNPAETRDAEHHEDLTMASWETSSSWEARSPKEEAAPITPETRAEDVRGRRVHFAPGIKEVTRPDGSRRLNFPPRVGPSNSRLPPGFAARGGAGFPPPFSRGMHQQQHSMPPPWMRQHMMPPPGFMPPPPPRHLMHHAGHPGPHHLRGPPHAAHHGPGPAHHGPVQVSHLAGSPSHTRGPHQAGGMTSQWICDYCNIASFESYEEACIHEESCRHRMGQDPRRQQPQAWHPTMQQQHPQTQMGFHPTHSMPPLSGPPSRQSVRAEHQEQRLPADNREWFHGKVSLAIPDVDPEWLSELNCYIRSTCVQAFSATSEDVARTSKRGRIGLHQVGIRCRFCMHRSMNERAAAAVSYPTGVSGIYESVKRWQRVHLESCKDAPDEVKAKITQLGNDNVWIPTTRQYWADSAKALGMVDTVDGIRFGTDPDNGPDKNKLEASLKAQPALGEGPTEGETLGNGDFIVYAEDISMVPPYVYFLMRQVESCHFTEADRFVARSKGPVGYPGFQCRHCNGHAGLGKYFPVSSKSLSTNSTSQNIHAHLLKCRKCPAHVKGQLVALKEEKSKAPRLEPGWRKVFFDKVWVRLHGEEPVC